jgi:hydroxyacylglutathione hydrolase
MDSIQVRLGDDTYLSIYRSIYAPVQSNMYVIIQDDKAVVIDPNISEKVEALLKENSVSKVYILLTHEHYDHTSGLLWFTEHFNCEIILTEVCANIVKDVKNNNPMLIAFVLAEQDRLDKGSRYKDFRKKFVPYQIIADKTVQNNEVLELLERSFTFRFTPGHSPSSCCIELDNIVVFTGDTLIKDTQTITRFKESNKNEYLNIAIPYLKQLNQEIYVLPGHFEPFYRKEINI